MSNDIFQLQWIVKEHREPVTLLEVFYNRLCDEFPDIDIDMQLENAHEYAELNFLEPVYAKNLERFILRWMRRHQIRAEQIKRTFLRTVSRSEKYH